jgi:hypothetical protein
VTDPAPDVNQELTFYPYFRLKDRAGGEGCQLSFGKPTDDAQKTLIEFMANCDGTFRLTVTERKAISPAFGLNLGCTCNPFHGSTLAQIDIPLASGKDTIQALRATAHRILRLTDDLIEKGEKFGEFDR